MEACSGQQKGGWHRWDDHRRVPRLGDWIKVTTALETGQYRPSPVRRVEIDKPDGGKRQLGIPTITDRVIQQDIAQVLTPTFDPDFSDNSFGFRPNRNGQQAVKQVQGIIKTGRRFAVDVDLSKFLDRVNHYLLLPHSDIFNFEVYAPSYPLL